MNQTGPIRKTDLREASARQMQQCQELIRVVEGLSLEINDPAIGTVVAKRTSIPVSKMMTAEKDRLMNKEAHLSSKIVGQDSAIKSVANTTRKARAGLKLVHRLVGSFLLL